MTSKSVSAGLKNYFWQVKCKNKAILTRLKKKKKTQLRITAQKPAKYKEKYLNFNCFKTVDKRSF